MKLWKRASIAIKDGPSLIGADDILTAAVVKATNHDELSMDTESALLIYRHVRSNPSSLKPLISAISSRVKRTRSWTVALKGLMLTHGFFLCKTTSAESVGRLPFDISDFGEGNSRMSRSGGFNLFVRAYFAFLDRRSILFHDGNRHRYDEESSVMIRLVIIRKMQSIVDSLIRIKPVGENMRKMDLINEAMENVISEILEVYGWICRRIGEVLPNVHSKIGKTQAGLALKIVAKSVSQGEELRKYFEFCRDFGVSNAQEIPEFVRIPETDVLHLDELVRTEETEVRGEAMEMEMEMEMDLCEEDAERRNGHDDDDGGGGGEERVTKCELVCDLITLDENDEEEEAVSSSPPPPRLVDIPDLISF